MSKFLFVICLIGVVCNASAQQRTDFQGLGDVNFTNKNYQAAIDFYTQAIDSNKLDKNVLAVVYFYRAKSYEALAHYGKALLDYSSAISLNPLYADAYSRRGVLYENRYFDYQKSADDYYHEIAIRQPNEHKRLSIVYADLANDEFNMGKIDSALKLEAIAISLDSDNFRAYNARAGIYTYLKENQKAIDDFSRSIKHYKGNDYKLLSSMYVQSADEKLVNKQYKEAINDFSAAIKIDPDNSSAYWDRGSTYYIHGDFALAIDDYTRAMNYYKGNGLKLYSLYDNRALSEIGENLIEAAIKDELKAVDINKNRGEAYIHLGAAYTKKDDYSKAVDAYLLGAWNTIGSKSTSYIYSLVAGDEYFLKKYAKASVYCDTALLWDASNPSAYYYRAKICLKKNQKDQAIENFNRFFTLDTLKNSTNYVFSLFYTGRGDQALDMLYQKLLSANHNMDVSSIYYDLACLNALMNKPDDANTYLRSALDKGYSKKRAESDENLDNIRETSDYKSIMHDGK